MPKTVINIENELAGLLGAGSKAELSAEDQVTLRSLVQECVTECFLPDEGHRPEWATRYTSAYFPAPQTATLSLTQGSKAIASGVPAGALPGARILIGESFYTYAGESKLVGEWAGATGDIGATFYYHQVAAPADMTAILDSPQALDIGPLYPLSGLEEEQMLRSFYESDFFPFASRYQAIGYMRRTFKRSRAFEIGDPWFYWLDSSSVNPFEYPTPVNNNQVLETEETLSVEVEGVQLSGTIPVFYVNQRFSIYPLPDRAMTVEYRIACNPQLTSDTQAINMPADAISSILMPLCREAVAETFPDYRGNNINNLIRRAEKARKKLKTLSQPQRRGAKQMQKAPGW